MYLMTVGGMFVSASLLSNICMCTVSNALLMSSATSIVRVGGFLSLKPCMIVLTNV